MYQPAHGKFAVDDPATLLAELSSVSPATLVTIGPDGFRTTILPMLWQPGSGAHGTLFGHVARPNPQWKATDGTAAVAIFHGPDAYVSPAWYEEKRRTGRVVPTWNYVVAIAHGTLHAHDDIEWLQAHVRRLVDRHEAGRVDPWSVDDAPDGYVAGQAKGIVGLELRVTQLEAKRKLSQNRSPADVDAVIDALSTGEPPDRAVAAAMLEERHR